MLSVSSQRAHPLVTKLGPHGSILQFQHTSSALIYWHCSTPGSTSCSLDCCIVLWPSESLSQQSTPLALLWSLLCLCCKCSTLLLNSKLQEYLAPTASLSFDFSCCPCYHLPSQLFGLPHPSTPFNGIQPCFITPSALFAPQPSSVNTSPHFYSICHHREANHASSST